MMKLGWFSDGGEVRFRLDAAESCSVPIEQWGMAEIVTQHGRGSVARLLALWEAEDAVWDGETLRVPYSQVAEFDAVALRAVGLPPPANVRLRLRGRGPLSSRDFRIDYQLVGADGIPLMGTTRQGVFLETGGQTFTLLNPLYEILERVARFNVHGIPDMEERFVWWGELKALLPEGADVDEHLAGMEIARAEAFTLDWDNENGLVPTPLGQRADEKVAPDSPLLPGEAQRRLVERLRAGRGVNRRYALGGGWFLTIGEPLRKALETVKEYLDKPLEQQRALLENPTRVLKERLGEVLSDEDLELVFRETPLYVSARVKGLGRWEPKICAYVIPTDNQWFPPEERALSVVADGVVVQVRAGEVDEAISAIRAAQEAGHPTATVAGQEVPATDKSLEAFLRLAGKDDWSGDREARGRLAEVLVPLIRDNLEDLEYRPKAEARASEDEIRGLPGSLRTSLLPHQRDGLKWLMEHWVVGSPGALLADDMGLGKTLQALAFLARIREIMESGARPKEPFLVVAPTGLLRNWEAEAARHLEEGCLGIMRRLHSKELNQFRSCTHREAVERLQDAGWVLTTYETMRDRIDLFMGVRWAVAVFDEAQKIKNPVARVTEMAKAVGADFTLAMTGTPVENRLADLWSIVDTVHPGFLGPLKDFHQAYEIPAADNPAQASALDEKLRKGKPPLVLRRLKTEHLRGLPERRVEEHVEEMPPPQAAAYDALIAEARAGRGGQGAVLKALHGLRRVSLIAGELGPEGLTDDVIDSSARLRALVNILDHIHAAGEKALIFVEYLDMQQALVPYIQRRYGLPHPPPVISGNVPGRVRQRLVDGFQESRQGEFGVMILSPKAGGVGLTITAANHVVHLTRWWNPAVEEQCNDRVYRIGQEKPVTIHLLHAVHPEIKEHSFDLNLHALLERKRSLCEAAFAPPVATADDLEALYRDSVDGEAQG